MVPIDCIQNPQTWNVYFSKDGKPHFYSTVRYINKSVGSIWKYSKICDSSGVFRILLKYCFPHIRILGLNEHNNFFSRFRFVRRACSAVSIYHSRYGRWKTNKALVIFVNYVRIERSFIIFIYRLELYLFWAPMRRRRRIASNEWLHQMGTGMKIIYANWVQEWKSFTPTGRRNENHYLKPDSH